MPTGLSDTDPAAEAVQVELIRQAPIWRREELAAKAYGPPDYD